MCLEQILSQSLYLRVHGHGGEFGVDASAGRRCRVTGEGLRWRHPIPPAKLQRAAAKHLFDLRQVRLCRYHHAGSLTVQEVLLRQRNGIRPCWLQVPSVRVIYLKDAGAVFKGIRLADIIHQADDVAGQIHIRQVVKVWEHFVKLGTETTPFFDSFLFSHGRPAAFVERTSVWWSYLMFGDTIPAIDLSAEQDAHFCDCWLVLKWATWGVLYRFRADHYRWYIVLYLLHFTFVHSQEGISPGRKYRWCWSRSRICAPL